MTRNDALIFVKFTSISKDYTVKVNGEILLDLENIKAFESVHTEGGGVYTRIICYCEDSWNVEESIDECLDRVQKAVRSYYAP
jgi:hypothetical protein